MTDSVVCEHSWSIEGWVHSKKRNRLGQDFRAPDGAGGAAKPRFPAGP